MLRTSLLRLGVFPCLVILAGCVLTTKHVIEAHITVDIRHIEQQAGEVLDFVEGTTDTPPTVTPAPEKSSMLERTLQMFSPMQKVYAADSLKQASPRVTELATKMRDRNPQVQEFRKQGVFGESNRGYIELRDESTLASADAKNQAQRLMADENRDRKALYEEVARLNSDRNLSVTAVEKVFAGERLKRARAGEWFQLPAEGPEFDALKSGATGQKLGDKCKPAAWVQM
jgi:uncharacterized protein YdbL (DUF1318 family)